MRLEQVCVNILFGSIIMLYSYIIFEYLGCHDFMRLEQENDKLAQQLLTKQIGMVAELDRYKCCWVILELFHLYVPTCKFQHVIEYREYVNSVFKVGRHELQLGEGGYREQERAGGSLGGKSTAWGGCLVSVFHFYSNHSLLHQI